MKKILFVTGNKRKAWEAADILKDFDIEVEAQELDVTEIQAEAPLEIAVAKAEAAYAVAGQPLAILDHSWDIPALGGFPGGYMKDINYWFKPQDFLDLMQGKDRTIYMIDCVVYIDETGTKPFVTKHKAVITEEARGKFPVPCAQVIRFEGQTKTFAELVDDGKQIRDMKASSWYQFGKWYSSQNE